MTYKPCFSCFSLIYILLLTRTLWAVFCGQLNNQSSAQGVTFKCCYNQSEFYIFFTITRSWSIVTVTADWSTQSFDHCCTSIKAIAFIITWLWLWLNKNWDAKYSDLQRRFEDYLNCLKIMLFIGQHRQQINRERDLWWATFGLLVALISFIWISISLKQHENE